mmetsp:Transcript_14821/g.32195  ORF Transcript_14821/g.32195 Transcript_14821/m.32195 type:complete len:500 (+) Transcript_14821:288-1787(+)|eukprot:CAMPEP_0172308780 /NCGR_PEP_ID=MMETSP1058-20130122/9278_1 /TAXON_ID=83371 /ORGANISM="Detonula confervacea, Strain CCMP 353" /LENGTH=499 /DNA_ID=CAMNT_0013021277 /DNA_START=204 /DNA_END=1703 /DNA_ORIENTATION=+
MSDDESIMSLEEESVISDEESIVWSDEESVISNASDEESILSLGEESVISDDESTMSDIFPFRNDARAREYHRIGCEKGDGWSHAFKLGTVVDQIFHVDGPIVEVVKLFVKQNWKKMGEALRKCTSLRSLDLGDCALTEEIIETLFRGEWIDNCLLGGSLILTGTQLGSSGVAAMLPFLKSISTLTQLNLSRTNLDNQGARLISEVLQHTRIECLILCDNVIGDEGIEHLLLASNSTSLVSLDLEGNDVVGMRGIDALAQFLGRDDTLLESLSSNCDGGADATFLVDSISSESKLERIYLWPRESAMINPMMSAGPNLQNLVCNISSFESLCQSNHRLMLVGGTQMMSQLDPTLKIALDINCRSKRGVSVGQRLRSKLRAFYFNSSFDVEPFIDMPAALMPYVIELVTRTESRIDFGEYYELCRGNLDGIYCLIRNCHLPEIFCFPSPESKTQKLEAEIVALKAAIEGLKLKNEELMIENEGFRVGSSGQLNKRTKIAL